MKRLHPELFNELKRTSAKLVTAFKLVRTDGVTLGFTAGDLAFTYDGLEYSPTNAFSGTAAAAKTNFSVDNMNAVALLTDKITAADLKGGLFDNARVYVFWVRPDKPEWGICPIRGGRLGEIKIKQGTFETELRSVAQRIQQRTGRVFTLECSATYGDAACKLSVEAALGAVTTKVTRWKWIDSTLKQATGWFKYGHVKWSTGANAGLSCEVREHTRAAGENTVIQLLEAMPHPIQVGDTYSITRGCDKSRLTCRNRGNLVNYRGFPDMPTEDKALATPNFSSHGTQKKQDSGS